MAINRNWVKTDGTVLTFAPTWLKTDAGLVVNPSEEQYRAAGWMLNAVEPPSPPEVQMVTSTQYAVKCERGLYSVEAVYEYAPIPQGPKRYSRKRFYLALARRNVYTQFKSWAEAADVLNGLTVWELLQVSTYLQSDDAEFLAMKAVADATFGAELIDAVLAESEDEEW